jgi:hypothetical protein
MGSYRINTEQADLKSVYKTTFKELADVARNWGNRSIRITKPTPRLRLNTTPRLRLNTRNTLKYSKQKSAFLGIPKNVITFIQNTTSKDKLTTLRKKLNDPQSAFNKLNHTQKGIINRLILDKTVALDGGNKATTQQTREPLKSSFMSSTHAKKIINFVNNATSTNQLTKLQNKLNDPKSQLSKLPKAQKRDIDRLIIDKMVAISDAQASRKRS